MKQRVLIGVPAGGSVHSVFLQSLTRLQRWELENPNDKYELVDIVVRSGLYIQENRNHLVKDMRDMSCDWLLQLDSDYGFEPNFLQMIMRNADAEKFPMIFGLYSNIGSYSGTGSVEVVDCVYREMPDGKYQSINVLDNGQMIEVDAAGTGLFLSHKSVYDKIPEPWFSVEYFQNTDSTIQMMNEDLSFCRVARHYGLHIWCDPMAEAFHYKTIPLLPSTMRSFVKNIQDMKRYVESDKRVDESIEGWMDRTELLWLHDMATRYDRIVEVGCWKGRSTYALLRGASRGVVWAVDHFDGSPSELETNHREAKDGKIYEQFLKNVGSYNNLRVLKKSSIEASLEFDEKSVDMVFIDGDHERESIVNDLRAWLPKCRKMICGHDLDDDRIKDALGELNLEYRRGPGSIWFMEIEED
jgi:SAM-dependent methyltransferase